MTPLLPPPPIVLLDEATISRIAAGEVVERPASVVKELVENSLDAGAHSVRVEIAGGGLQLIRVSDDGAGVPADQLALAFHRHATSKVRSADDLVGVTSMGFRGEALAAIASVARVRMQTRTADGPGMEISATGGVAGEPRPTGAPVGTTVEVESLFFSVPARRKFLASAVTEGNRVADVVARIALAFPEVQFTLIRDGRSVLATPGTGRRRDAVAAVLGRASAGELLEVRSAPSGSAPRGSFRRPRYTAPRAATSCSTSTAAGFRTRHLSWR
jgi:DNA mismatch repair protein MutL